MLKEEIYKKIRYAIDFGLFSPGEHLTETSLSKRFGCSRAPIREALSLLEREGFISLVPNHGALVNKNSPQEIEDFYRLLELLEGQAVEWATLKLNNEDIHKLTEINNALKQLSKDDSEYVEKWHVMNLAFHRVIWEKSGNQKMAWIAEEIILRITRYRYSFLIMRNAKHYEKDHELIIESIRSRNVREARKRMEKHIARGKKLLMEFYMSNPKAGEREYHIYGLGIDKRISSCESRQKWKG
jgi:DNA-binding GntR family transcriptional regulator